MSKSKEIDAASALTLLKGSSFAMKFYARGYFNDFPEETDASVGVKVLDEDVLDIVDRTSTMLLDKFKDLFGQLPDVPEIEDLPDIWVRPPEAEEVTISDVELNFTQTVQTDPEFGLLFTNAILFVDGENTDDIYKQESEISIKMEPKRVGKFLAKNVILPTEITKVVLYMYLDKSEGIANADNSSVVEITDKDGKLIRTLTAAMDIKGAGYNKSNNRVPIDLTEYFLSLRTS